MIDFYKFSPPSVWGRDVIKKSESDFLKEVTKNYNKILNQINNQIK